MDDSLEQPSPFKSTPSVQQGEDEQSSGDEDGGLDWTKLSFGTLHPVIPKRGEKEFEPAPGGGSGLQLHVQDRARNAMFETLRTTPTTSSKSISYGIWHPGIARVQITLARGMHFTVMGHSAPRPLSTDGQSNKTQKKLELLPEEAIYLIERGALFCFKASHQSFSSIAGLEDIEGSPMSVQQAYSEMIGSENLTLEKYQVFAYLRRLGYVVTRTDPPTSSYPSPPPNLKTSPELTVFQRLLSVFSSWVSRVSRPFTRNFNWWRPLHFSRWLHHDKNYGYLVKTLRFIPAGHDIPIRSPQPTSTPYKIFYNLYKPSTPFRKSAPPPPDFSIVVINARTTPMPSLGELTALFDVLPEVLPPLPRQKQKVPPTSVAETSVPTLTTRQTFLRQLVSWIFPPLPLTTPQVRKPNPFLALKSGKKNVVVAAVDMGSISFFRFNQGAFSEWPMI